jgi:surface antigen
VKYLVLFSVFLFYGCAISHEESGSVIGGGVGYISSKKLGGDSSSVLVGTVVGIVAGNKIGRYMREEDIEMSSNYISTLDTGESGEWRNISSGNSFQMTVNKVYMDKETKKVCKDITFRRRDDASNRIVNGGTQRICDF